MLIIGLVTTWPDQVSWLATYRALVSPDGLVKNKQINIFTSGV
jgi:hypothetical protein